MLVARRDPPLHGDARDIAPVHFEANPRSRPPRVVRFVTVMQMIGSLVAVPVGIGSAYTFYRANFSPETTCQSLRSGIIAMLDKSVDASTRRILVRRDVETFETACASVDPEATAAFKTLLAAETEPRPAAATRPVPKVQPSDTTPKEQTRKAESRTQATPKQVTTNGQIAVGQNARREPAVSDTQWLDSVRQALVTHQRDVRPVETSKPRPYSARSVQPEAEPSAPSAVAPPAAAAATAPPAATAPASAVAPTLPPPVAIAPGPAQQDAGQLQHSDHPVPPESIPSADAVAAADAKTNEPRRSRIGKWISTIPLLGNVVDNARH